jgi:UDP-N-acetylglucosamine kinase
MAHGTRYQLAPEENERIFRDLIVPREFTGCRPQAQPVVVFIGGQTGAGKTAVTSMVSRAFQHGDGYANANMDFYTPYHPHYERLRQRDEATASAHVRHDTEAWWAKAQEHAISQRYNVVVESAMRSRAEFEDLMPQFRDSGYRVEVALLAVPESLSRLGILYRYWGEVRDVGHGRLIDPSIHDECYRGVVRGASALDQSGLADRVFVFRRNAQVVYSNRLDENRNWVHRPGAANAVVAERSRRWSTQEATWFRSAAGKLRQDIDPRWHGELDQIRGLATRLLPPDPLQPTLSPEHPAPSWMPRGPPGPTPTPAPRDSPVRLPHKDEPAHERRR